MAEPGWEGSNALSWAHSLGGDPRKVRKEVSPISIRSDRTWQTLALLQHGGEGGQDGVMQTGEMVAEET